MKTISSLFSAQHWNFFGVHETMLACRTRWPSSMWFIRWIEWMMRELQYKLFIILHSHSISSPHIFSLWLGIFILIWMQKTKLVCCWSLTSQSTLFLCKLHGVKWGEILENESNLQIFSLLSMHRQSNVYQSSQAKESLNDWKIFHLSWNL